jgi:drug/metabolite transporter (DMT)-like permease
MARLKPAQSRDPDFLMDAPVGDGYGDSREAITMIRTTGPSMSAANWGRLIALACLWGLSFPLIKVAVRDIPPLTVLFGRVSLAAAALYIALRATRTPIPRGRDAWVAFFGMGLIGNLIPWSLQFWGQKHLPVGLASILNAATPAFSVIVMHVFTSDKATLPRGLGVALGFVGVAVLIGPTLLMSAGSALALPELAFLTACLFYAFSGLFGRTFGRLGLKPLQTAFGLMAATSLMAAPGGLLIEAPWSLPLPSLGSFAAVLALALASTALAYILFFRILVEAGPTNVMLVTLLVPVMAIMIGVVFMGETIEARNLAGMALIAVGLAFIDGRVVRALARGGEGGKP